MKAGYEAQLKSIVLLKNKGQVLPIEKKKTVFIPPVYRPAAKNWWNQWTEPTLENPANEELVKQYYHLTNQPQEADFAIVFVSSPQSENGGYSPEDRQSGGNGYVPIPLQYNPYTATDARENSLAAGDPVTDPEISHRSYKNKSTRTLNAGDLDVLLKTRKMMGNKPVIAVIDLSNPMIFNEFEKEMDAIVIRFGSSIQSVLDIIAGKQEPSGLLPLQMPANMRVVEKQNEDVPFDMECHKDTEGNRYDFAFGLNWKGIIQDNRTVKYGKH
jgi:beta-glucosidase